MRGHLSVVGICALWLSASAMAQSTVTTSGGTVNTVPAFTGSASVGNSPITISGSNVGFGATNLDLLLVVGAAGGGQKVKLIDVAGASRWSLGTGNYQFHIANDLPSVWADRLVIYQGGTVNATASVNGAGNLNITGTDNN